MNISENGEGVLEVCPLCGSQLEKGFIGLWRGIYWSDKKPPKVVWKLPFGEDMLIRGTSCEAYRCQKCKLVIFKYGESNPAEGSRASGNHERRLTRAHGNSSPKV